MKQYILFFLTILLASNLYAKVSYSTARRVEKLSPILSIVLYEDIIDHSKYKNSIRKAANRLYYLYMKYNRYEDIFILVEKYPPNRSTKRKIDILVKEISRDFGIKKEMLKEVFKLATQKDIPSRKKLLNILKHEHDDLTLKYMLKYIFAIKIKIKELGTLRYIISELPILYPDFRMVYYVASREENVDKIMKELSAISDLSNAEKLDLLFYYASYLRSIGLYRMSVRFFRMSYSFSQINRAKFSINRSLIETAKTLLIAGNSKEGCNLIKGYKFPIENEGDEVLDIYCNTGRRNKRKLKALKPSLNLLSKKDNGQLYRKILKAL